MTGQRARAPRRTRTTHPPGDQRRWPICGPLGHRMYNPDVPLNPGERQRPLQRGQHQCGHRPGIGDAPPRNATPSPRSHEA